MEQKAVLNLKPAIFLHIQKTAGTTIVTIARSAYGNENVASHGDFLKGANLHPNYGEFWIDKKVINNFHSIPFLSGHFGYSFSKQYMQNRYSFTILRDPAERILSLYYYCKNQDPDLYRLYKICQQKTLDEFLKMGLINPEIKSYMWNNQVWQLACGFGNMDNRGLSSFTADELIELAVNHLKDFSYIGFVETFEKDRNNILNALGIAAPAEKIVLNANPDRPVFDDLPQLTKDLLMQLTELDRILYGEAKKSFSWDFKNILNRIV
jgi:hypothetical protein